MMDKKARRVLFGEPNIECCNVEPFSWCGNGVIGQTVEKVKVMDSDINMLHRNISDLWDEVIELRSKLKGRKK